MASERSSAVPAFFASSLEDVTRRCGPAAGRCDHGARGPSGARYWAVTVAAEVAERPDEGSEFGSPAIQSSSSVSSRVTAESCLGQRAGDSGQTQS